MLARSPSLPQTKQRRSCCWRAPKAGTCFGAAPNPLLLFLHCDRKQPISWLWWRTARIPGISLVDENGIPNLTKQLLPGENTLLVHLKEEMDCARELNPPPKGYTPLADLCYAFKVSEMKLDIV